MAPRKTWKRRSGGSRDDAWDKGTVVKTKRNTGRPTKDTQDARVGITRETAKYSSPFGRRLTSGYLLVEIIMYMALWALITGLAFGVFFKGLSSWRDLSRQSDDIVRTTKAGEQWRADIRRAVASPRVIQAEASTALEIQTESGLAVYIFEKNSVWRKEKEEARWQLLLSGVKISQMQRVAREKVAAWNWELELSSKRKQAKVPPRFTFLAVPGSDDPL
jgi:hypothetical protein